MTAVRYGLIGDSQGVGLSVPLAARIPLAYSGPQVGWTTARIFGTQLTEALASSADTVLVVTGGNDDPLSNTAFDQGVARARAARKQVIIVGPVFALTDDAVRHDRARLALATASARNGVRFIDAYPLTRDLASTANVHLAAAKYVTYASRLATALRPAPGGLGTGILLGLGALVLWKLS